MVNQTIKADGAKLCRMLYHQFAGATLSRAVARAERQHRWALSARTKSVNNESWEKVFVHLPSRGQRGESEAGCLIAIVIIAVIGFALYDRYQKKKLPEATAAATVQTKTDRDADALNKLAEAKTWRVIALPNIDKNVYATLYTSWRNGKIFYRFELQPKSPAIAQEMRTDSYGRKQFVVALLDQSQFAIVKIPVTLRALTRIVDEQDNVLSYLANDSIECDRKSYEDLRDWTVQWQF